MTETTETTEMRYMTLRCPTCANDTFSVVMADGHPYYLCDACETHILRRDLVRVDGHLVGEFKVYVPKPVEEPKAKEKKKEEKK